MLDLDEALERFQAGALEYAGGLANHGPMAAEALLRLGHAAKLPGFLELYAPRRGARQVGQAMDESQRQEALGRFERMPDWVATFERALQEGPWQQVLGLSQCAVARAREHYVHKDLMRVPIPGLGLLHLLGRRGK